MNYKVKLRRVRETTAAIKKAISITRKALVIRHATHMRRITIYCHLWTVWLHHILALFLINNTIFGKSY